MSKHSQASSPSSYKAANDSNNLDSSDISSDCLTFSVSAPGKVILHGEHSVVYDKLAIAASLGLRTKLTLMEQKCSPGHVKIELPTLDLVQCYDLTVLQKHLLDKPLPLVAPTSNYNWEQPELINYEALLSLVQNFVRENTESSELNAQQKMSLCSVFYLFAAILQSVGITLEPFVLRIDTDLTVSAGTGSSASFSVTIAAAFIHYIRLKVSKLQLQNLSKSQYKRAEPIFTSLNQFNEKELKLISKWAYMAEKIIHGSPSGIDNTVCTYGSIVEFRKTGGLKVIPKCEFKLLLINTKVQRDTKRLVKHVATLKERHTKIVELILNVMDEISQSALTCVMKLNRCNDLNQPEAPEVEIKELYDKLGELTDMNQYMLQALGVSHPTLDKICEIAKRAGLHSKLTGAGGGGYAIVLIPPYIAEQAVERIIGELTLEGFEAVLTKLGGSGVTVD